MRLPALALAAMALLAGCVGGAGDSSNPPSGPTDPAPSPALRATALAITVVPAWARPGEPVALAVPGAGNVSWFLAARAPVAGPKQDTGDLAPGVPSEPLALATEGLLLFHCHPHPWMRLNVTVGSSVPSLGTRHVQIVDGASASEYRFVPSELAVAPGERVVLWNNGSLVHTATQVDAWRLIAGRDPSLSFTPSIAGDFDVVAITSRGAERGEGRARLLVDPAKPDESLAIGPFAGEFDHALAAAGRAASQEFGFEVPYPMTELRLSFTASSSMPVPPTARIDVGEQGGPPLATSASGAVGEVSLAGLAAGYYSVVVTAEQGVLVSYEVTGVATLDLSARPAAAPGAEGAPHDH